MTDYLELMLNQYMGTALWSSIGDDGEPLDSKYEVDDITPETRKSMEDDCRSFIAAAGDGEWNGSGTDLLAGIDAGQAGHDFWLTRNRHGAGFWDRGLGDIGDRLTKLAHGYGESDLLVGDDGSLYLS